MMQARPPRSTAQVFPWSGRPGAAAIALGLALLAPGARGEDMASFFGRMGGGRARLRLAPDVTFYSEENVTGQAATLDLARYDLSATMPLARGESDSWSLSVSASLLDVDTTAVFPQTGAAVPDELWKVNLGLGYGRRYDDGRFLGVRASVGSASDEPFDSGDETTFSTVLFYRKPAAGRNAWLYFLALGNNREELDYVPIPGFAYWSQPSEKFQALIGLPFLMLNYRPSPRWALGLSYFAVTNVRASTTFRPHKRVGIYASYDWRHDSYFRAGRDLEDEKLFNYEMRAALGVKVDLPRKLSVDVSAGWSFDRFMFESEDYFDRDRRVDLEDAFCVRVKLAVTAW